MIENNERIDKEVSEILKSTLNIHDQREIWIQTGVSKPSLKKIYYGDAIITGYTYDAAIHMVNYARTKLEIEVELAKKSIAVLKNYIPEDKRYDTNVIKPTKYKRKK